MGQPPTFGPPLDCRPLQDLLLGGYNPSKQRFPAPFRPQNHEMPQLKSTPPNTVFNELVRTSALSPCFAPSTRKRAVERGAGDGEPPGSSGEGGEGAAPALAVAHTDSPPEEHTQSDRISDPSKCPNENVPSDRSRHSGIVPAHAGVSPPEKAPQNCDNIVPAHAGVSRGLAAARIGILDDDSPHPRG